MTSKAQTSNKLIKQKKKKIIQSKSSDSLKMNENQNCLVYPNDLLKYDTFYQRTMETNKYSPSHRARSSDVT